MTTQQSTEPEPTRLVWHNALDIGIEGKGWKDTIDPFDRIPAKAEAVVRKAIWHMKRSSTGMCLRFRTSAEEIHARWEIEGNGLGEANFNRCAHSGLDLYGDDHGTWKWVGATQNFDSYQPEVCIIKGLDGEERDYLLYLPLRNKLISLEVGVPVHVVFTGLPPRTQPPILVYGSSIVQGAYASRCGMVYPSILGRRLQLPILNLGFSGNAIMEPELAELFGELEVSAYILDPMPNMDLQMVEERTAAFILRLKELKPHTPIVMIGDFQRTNNWALTEERTSLQKKIDLCRNIVEDLISSGIEGLSFIEGESLLGDDHEASIDGIHPGDVGFLRMAQNIEQHLKQVLNIS